MRTRVPRLSRLAVWACLACGVARAQEAMYTAAATMPSPGVTVLRQQFMVSRFGGNPESESRATTQYESSTLLSYGIVRALAVTVELPAYLRTDEFEAPRGDDHDRGIGDIEVTFKHRVYKDDTGGVNTLRVAILGGAGIASGDDHDFSSTSVNPFVGGVLTLVRGRHGFNQDLMFRWNTGGDLDSNLGGEGPSDVVRADTAYLYRVYPDRFNAESVGAWYATAEVNAMLETNADLDARLGLGLMYEGPRWALEFMGQLPLYQNVDHRGEFRWGLGMGVRFIF